MLNKLIKNISIFFIIIVFKVNPFSVFTPNVIESAKDLAVYCDLPFHVEDVLKTHDADRFELLYHIIEQAEKKINNNEDNLIVQDILLQLCDDIINAFFAQLVVPKETVSYVYDLMDKEKLETSSDYVNNLKKVLACIIIKTTQMDPDRKNKVERRVIIKDLLKSLAQFKFLSNDDFKILYKLFMGESETVWHEMKLAYIIFKNPLKYIFIVYTLFNLIMYLLNFNTKLSNIYSLNWILYNNLDISSIKMDRIHRDVINSIELQLHNNICMRAIFSLMQQMSTNRFISFLVLFQPPEGQQ